jgi:hypothetical protein
VTATAEQETAPGWYGKVLELLAVRDGLTMTEVGQALGVSDSRALMCLRYGLGQGTTRRARSVKRGPWRWSRVAEGTGDTVMTATSEQDSIRAKAGELFEEKFRKAGWTDQDFSSYAGWRIQETVRAIAAGGEQAAVAAILSMFSARLPRLDPATGRISDIMLERCMDVIQEARHAQFPGNTGWTWDEKDQQWTARRGTAVVVARFPRDQMPPVRADQFAVQLTGENYYGPVSQVMENPGEANLPWSHPVLAEIPEEFWTDDWCRGVRWRVYLGNLCSHSGRESPACIQPRRESQAEGMEAPCVPFDPDHVRLMVLDGKLSDYS